MFRRVHDHVMPVWRALGWLVPVLLALAVAFGIGTASARAILGDRVEASFVRAGAWRVEPSGGGAGADPYTRARLARSGMIPLGRAEGIALTAVLDDTGRPLSASCRYEVVGPMPPARLWSLWVEPETSDPARPSAMHAGGIVRDRDGGFVVTASRDVAPGNWLALPLEGSFTMRLALYDTPVARTGNASSLLAPAIRRLGCDGPQAPPAPSSGSGS